MSIKEVSAEQLAQLFHHYHEALAADFGCNHQPSAETWGELSANEQRRMVAAARLALLEINTHQDEQEQRRWFAKPGQAEWGC